MCETVNEFTNARIHRIYVGALAPHTVVNVGSSRPPTKEDHSTALTRTDVSVTKAGLPDTVVWNPWTEKAKAMSDMDDDEVCQLIRA